MDFKNSETFKNLHKAYEGELKASAKYKIYSIKSKEDGYQQIGDIFEETSHNEREHAEIWLKIINKGDIPNTLRNLEDAYSGENYEWTKMYFEFAETAEKEGYKDIARLFRGVAKIERHHDYRFEKLAENIRKSEVFCKKTESIWICMNCGNLHWGECAPKICPICEYPQGYYKMNCENY